MATLLDSAGIDPTVVNGGIITGWGSNARLGKGQWMVVEADESDGSFAKLNPTVAVVTNIDPEHLDHHGSYEALEQAFLNFVSSIPFYGFATLCIDHPAVQRMMAGIKDRRIITYGSAANADVRAVNVRSEDGSMVFDVQLSDRICDGRERLNDVRLPNRIIWFGPCGEHQGSLESQHSRWSLPCKRRLLPGLPRRRQVEK